MSLRWHRARDCGNLPGIRIEFIRAPIFLRPVFFRPIFLGDETSTMEMSDILDFLHSAARSVGAEVTSPWFYLQLGLVMAGAGISFAAGTAIRAHTDMSTLAKEWPVPLRMMVRVLVSYSSTAVFAVLMRLARFVMAAST